MDVNYNDKLVLERDVKQLQQEYSNISDRLDRLKREQLDILDLNKKEKERLEKLQKDLMATNKEIADQKIAWSAEKRTQEDKLKQDKLEVTKILNRENYIKLEEQKLAKISLALDERKNALIQEENQRAEKESAIKLKEVELEKKEQKHLDQVKEFEKSLNEIKESVINHANQWLMK